MFLLIPHYLRHPCGDRLTIRRVTIFIRVVGNRLVKGMFLIPKKLRLAFILFK